MTLALALSLPLTYPDADPHQAADRERGKGGRDVETLQQQVQQLQRVLGEQADSSTTSNPDPDPAPHLCPTLSLTYAQPYPNPDPEQGENQLRIEDELSEALKADEKGALQRLDAQLAAQGNQAAAERRQLADEQSKLEGGVGRRLEAVQGELLGQAEQVGKELHARSEAISSLQQQLHATEENGAAALAAAQDAIERLAAAQQQAEESLGREREERREAEEQAQQRLHQAQQLQMEAHEAAEQRNAAVIAEVRNTLDVRLQAEQGLLKRLQLQHGQQEALEDKGVR